jgi:hypothetical protein
MPARNPVQAAVDRRFNYDDVRTIQAFSARARPADRAGHLTGELLTMLDQTMQPIVPSPPVR